MRNVALFVVGWCGAVLLTLAGIQAWRELRWPVRRWARRLRSGNRLVAWGGRPGWDIQIGSPMDQAMALIDSVTGMLDALIAEYGNAKN